MFQDMRFGLRMLRTGKTLTLVAALSLGLGVGATSVIYALVDQMLIHDVTAREPERLFRFVLGPWSSYPNFRDIRSSGVFAQLAADTACYPEPRWREGDRTHAITARCVSGNFFEVMGWQAARGRVFTEGEAAAEKDPRVVVISHQFWRRRLGGDANVIGRVLTLNHTAHTIIGAGFAFLASGALQKFPLRGSYLRFEFTPDWRFVCAAAAFGVIAAFVSGIAPSLASSRMNLSDAMRASQSTTPRPRLRSLLVVAQIAVSVTLLFGAFVFIRNMIHVLRFDPGFDAAHTLQFDLSTTAPKIYPVALREKVYRELESHPGVEAVSWAWYMPFNFVYGEYQLRLADKAAAQAFKVTAQGIGPGYLKTMGIRLLTGRELDWNDVPLYGKGAVEPAII